MTAGPAGRFGTWSSITLDQDVRVQVDPNAAALGLEPVPGVQADLATDLAEEVAAIWSMECARHPALFNGRVFSADRITLSLITGHWTEYRRVLAQIRRPTLFARLNIRPLAVNGLLECADGLILGRRQARAVYLPACWQAAPAGNVEARTEDDVELADQLFAELQEELGLPPEAIELIRPVAAIEHADTHVVDVGFLLRTALTFVEIDARRRRQGNDEYDLLRVVPPDAIGSFLEESGTMLLPSARILIEYWSGDRR